MRQRRIRDKGQPEYALTLTDWQRARGFNPVTRAYDLEPQPPAPVWIARRERDPEPVWHEGDPVRFTRSEIQGFRAFLASLRGETATSPAQPAA